MLRCRPSKYPALGPTDTASLLLVDAAPADTVKKKDKHTLATDHVSLHARDAVTMSHGRINAAAAAALRRDVLFMDIGHQSVFDSQWMCSLFVRRHAPTQSPQHVAGGK